MCLVHLVESHIKVKVWPCLEMGWGGVWKQTVTHVFLALCFCFIIYSGKSHPWRSFQRCQKAAHCSKSLQKWLDFVWTIAKLHPSLIVIISKDTVRDQCRRAHYLWEGGNQKPDLLNGLWLCLPLNIWVF